ncbi:MAG: primosomal protein N' (replication factor Y) - superfamily II helicase [Gemmobacter sp.]
MPAEQEHRWPCTACGADLTFAPGQRRLVCTYCGHEQEIPEAPQATRSKALRELDLQAALAGGLGSADTEEVRLTRCTGCGAAFEFDPAVHAKECPFCATPVVVGTGTSRQIKPQALIPFRLTEREAREAMVRWLGSLWFAPSGLQDYAYKGRALSGIYTPWWTFDAATRSAYAGERGDAYFETRTVTVNVNGRMERRQEQVRRIRWTPVRGHVSRFFDDLLVLASRALPRSHLEALDPWDLDALEPYRPDFLSGFRAEGYTVALPEAHAMARSRMEAQIAADVRRAIGGDEQRIARIHTDFSAETFKHILLPVWLAAYRYNGNSYRFVVNGQTGKVRGERPWSVWKIAGAVAAVLLIAAAIALASEMGR